MTMAIRYYSKTGNTKKLANAISEVLNIPAETVNYPLTVPVDILFLCSAVYGAGVDQQVKDFISSLSVHQVKRVVNISTAALLPSTYSQITKLLAANNIPLDQREFHCRGKFAIMHKGRPNQTDLQQVQLFAKSFMENQ